MAKKLSKTEQDELKAKHPNFFKGYSIDKIMELEDMTRPQVHQKRWYLRKAGIKLDNAKGEGKQPVPKATATPTGVYASQELFEETYPLLFKGLKRAQMAKKMKYHPTSIGTLQNRAKNRGIIIYNKETHTLVGGKVVENGPNVARAIGNIEPAKVRKPHRSSKPAQRSIYAAPGIPNTPAYTTIIKDGTTFKVSKEVKTIYINQDSIKVE